MLSSVILGSFGLMLSMPALLWFITWPTARERWLPHVVGVDHIHRGQFREAVVPRFGAAGPPMAVRLAALGSWILGMMFVPGLLLGLWGLMVVVGLVSVPGLILAWRLFFLGRPLLLGEPAAAVKARSLAGFARVLNIFVLSICGPGLVLAASRFVRDVAHSCNNLGALAVLLLVTVYAGVSLWHARLLDRAAALIDEQQATTRAVMSGVRVEVPRSEESPEEIIGGMSDERRNQRG